MEKLPQTLRTGLVGEVTPPDLPLRQRLVSLVFVLVKRAATTAAKYCSHSKRTAVTPRDVEYALKYHARTFFCEEGFDQLEQETNEMHDMVTQFMSDEVSSSEVVDAFADEIEEEYSEECEEEDCEDECGEECACDFCKAFRAVKEEEWDRWDPTDPAEYFIKHHIDQLVTEKNLDV